MENEMRKDIDRVKNFGKFINEGLEGTFNSALYSKREVITILEDLYVEVAKLYNEQAIPEDYLKQEAKKYIVNYVNKYTR